MKITKKQKLENRQAILKAAVAVVTEKGWAKTSLREIAQRCQMKDASLYNYFESKEEMVLAVYQDAVEGVLASAESSKQFKRFNAVEKLGFLASEFLSQLAPSEKFVELTFAPLFFQPLGLSETVADLRQKVAKQVLAILVEAEKTGEFSANPLREMAASLFWDYLVGVTFYWQKDPTENKTRTFELIDRTTALMGETLKVAFFQKGFEVFQFLIREHLMTRFLDAHDK